MPLPSEYNKVGFYKTYLHLGCDKREGKCGIFYASEILKAGKTNYWKQHLMVANKQQTPGYHTGKYSKPKNDLF